MICPYPGPVATLMVATVATFSAYRYSRLRRSITGPLLVFGILATALVSSNFLPRIGQL